MSTTHSPQPVSPKATAPRNSGMGRFWRAKGVSRAPRFRDRGLRSEAAAVVVVDPKALANELVAFLGTGRVVTQGKRIWVLYPAAMREQVIKQLRSADVRGLFLLCRTATGAVCLGPQWSRVRRNGVVIDVCDESFVEVKP